MASSRRRSTRSRRRGVGGLRFGRQPGSGALRGVSQPPAVAPQASTTSAPSALDQIQTITTVPPGRSLTLSIQWDEPFGDTVTDLDTYFIDPGLGTIIGGDETDNLQGFRPADRDDDVQQHWRAARRPIGFAVKRFAGMGTPFDQVRDREQLRRRPANRRIPHELGHHRSRFGRRQGRARGGRRAAERSGNQRPRGLQPRGPLLRPFAANGTRLGAPEVRPKPEIAAADGVSTTVPGFATFFGTSAAAPHAAAIAALMKSVCRR